MNKSAFDEYLFTPYKKTQTLAPSEEENTNKTKPISHSILRHQTTAQSEGSKDVRTGILQHDIRAVFRELLTAEHKEDVKSAYDFWNFLEPFFVPLTPEFFTASVAHPSAANTVASSATAATPLDSTVLHEAQSLLTAGEPPHFSLALAVDEVIDWTAVHALATSRTGAAVPWSSVAPIKTSLLASFKPQQKPRRQVETESFYQQVHRLTEIHDSSSALIDVIRQVAAMNSDAEVKSQTSRRTVFENLVEFANIQLKRLRQHHVADALEEFFALDASPTTSVLAVFEDGHRVHVRRLTVSTVNALLALRARNAGSLGDTGVATALLEMPASGTHQGPFCHICREAKPSMWKCGAKRRCARRFCADCLRLHNFPTPTTTSGCWTCTVCAQLCTCDRCVRQVYMDSAETFLTGVAGAVKTEDVDSEDFPGEPVTLEELSRKFPESHFAKSASRLTTSPIKGQPSNASLASGAKGKGRTKPESEDVVAPSVSEAEAMSVEFLTTPQVGRLRESERMVALTRTLNSIKNEQTKRIGQLKNLIRLAKASVEGIEKDALDVDTLVKEFFPNPRLTISSSGEMPQDAEVMKEYFLLLDSLTVKSKRARTLPEDSETDGEQRQAKRRAKLRKVAELEGSVEYLATVAPIGVRIAAERKSELVNYGFAAGVGAAKLARRFR